jgi:hypothetical protein
MPLATLLYCLRPTDALYMVAGGAFLKLVLGWGLGATVWTAPVATAGLVYLRRILTLGLPSQKNPKGAMAAMECVIV